LLHCDRFDARDFSIRLIGWYNHGYMAVDGLVFDVGIQTSAAISRLRSGVAPLEAGGTEEYSKGNGSLMRVLPLALWHQGSDQALVQDAHDQSRVTHGHVTVQACCALYCLWARRMLEQTNDPWSDALSALRSIYMGSTIFEEALEGEIRPDAKRVPQGSGFVLDCLFSAKQAVAAGSYETVVKTAIAFGQDTDTTACVAGGIAGIRDGLNAIPPRWRLQLRGRDQLMMLHDRLLEQRASKP